MSSDKNSRRWFLTSSGAVLSTAMVEPRSIRAQTAKASNKLVVGVMGMGGRGQALAKGIGALTDVEVAYVCDPDSQRRDQAVEEVGSELSRKPQGVTDFRRILDDKNVDVLIIATCNHWHAPAAILGCQAGKHVYVEKPCSQTAREGELMMEAARKTNRIIQVGTQRRSRPGLVEGTELVKSGAIGRVYLARAWYENQRPSIGHGNVTVAPSHLDYDLWQGPAPRRPYRDNLIHYNWHWFWHWGNGELGNNGVHTIDVCRWVLGVDYPTQVSATGGRFHWQDDQQTPDTLTATYRFGDQGVITWQGISCNKHRPNPTDEICFYGEKGAVAFSGVGYTHYDLDDKVVKTGKGKGGEKEHLQSFVDAIRLGTKPAVDIIEGHKSTLLSHLGNIAYRTGRSLRCDPTSGRILNDPEAMAYWHREYEPGFEPAV